MLSDEDSNSDSDFKEMLKNAFSHTFISDFSLLPNLYEMTKKNVFLYYDEECILSLISSLLQETYCCKSLLKSSPMVTGSKTIMFRKF